MTGTDLVDRLVGSHLAAGRGDHIAYDDTEAGEISYRKLHDAACNYAGGLRAAGIPAGSRLLVVADDSVATVVAVLGSWWHGCVPALASPYLPDGELEHVINDCSPLAVHIDARADRIDRLRHLAESLHTISTESIIVTLRGGEVVETRPSESAGSATVWPDDGEALLQYTSGSSGTPKGVRHSAGGIAAMLDGFAGVVDLRPTDRVLSTARMSFGYGFGSSVLCSLSAGATTILIRGSVDVHSVISVAEQHKPSVLCSVPRLYAALLARIERRPTSAFDMLRLCLSAGENCPGELADRVRRTFAPEMINCLGATEALHIVLCTRPDRDSLGSLGFPVPPTIITVRDDSGRVVPDGTNGRLHVVGPTVALGYNERLGTESQAFADGGLYTGDIVCRKRDGSLEYVCRGDDLLMLGGHKVAPRDIEQAVLAAEGVRECAVIGTCDEDGLTAAIAYVVPLAGSDPNVVRRLATASMREKLPPYKRPTDVQLLSEMPLTVTGKVAVHRLRALGSS